MDIKQKIHGIVTTHPVVLFMKGTPQMPQCGFSALAVNMLHTSGVKSFHSVNVLAEPDLRQGAKDYAQWPTFPQLYLGGEFVGGCDIMQEMFQSKELQARLQKILTPQKSSLS